MNPNMFTSSLHVRGLPALALLVGALTPGALCGQVAVVGELVRESVVESPGHTTGQITIRNGDSRPREARLTLADYSFEATGTTRYLAPGSLQRSSAPWIRFTPEQVLLGPGAEATVRYEVQVPAGLEGGTRWSVLLVEGLDPAEPPPAATAGEFRLRTVTRYAVQIATHIPGGSHDVAVDSVRVVRDAEGRSILSLDLTNTGTAGWRPVVRIELFTRSGEEAFARQVRGPLLYPASGTRRRFPLDDLPAGEYQALLTIDTGAPELFGAQFRVVL